MGQYITKNKAIDRINQHPQINSANTHFANINNRKAVWWLDIPFIKVSRSIARKINLLLYDNRTKTLHHLYVPVKFLKNNAGLVTRITAKKKKVISLELSADANYLFQDVRSKGSGVRFAKFEHCKTKIKT